MALVTRLRRGLQGMALVTRLRRGLQGMALVTRLRRGLQGMALVTFPKPQHMFITWSIIPLTRLQGCYHQCDSWIPCG
jgi:hypothetical protein